MAKALTSAALKFINKQLMKLLGVGAPTGATIKISLATTWTRKALPGFGLLQCATLGSLRNKPCPCGSHAKFKYCCLPGVEVKARSGKEYAKTTHQDIPRSLRILGYRGVRRYATGQSVTGEAG